MNLFNELVMEVEQEGKKFRTHLPANVTYQQCYEFLKQCAEQLVTMSKEWESQQAAAQAPVESTSDQTTQG